MGSGCLKIFDLYLKRLVFLFALLFCPYCHYLNYTIGAGRE